MEEEDLLDEALVSMETGEVEVDVEGFDTTVNGSSCSGSNLVLPTCSEFVLLMSMASGVWFTGCLCL